MAFRQSSKQRFVGDLSQCLFDFVIQLLPTQDELTIKEDVRKLLERLIRTIEPHSHLLAFGSTANGFSLRNSDMDLCCLIDSGERLAASDLVTMLGDLLERETKFHVKPLPHARIPIVKLSLDPSPGLPFGIACDIGFENRLAIENTRLLYSYAKIDPTRVRTLVLFLKIWSKRRKINSPYKGTLSSYGYVLLVIYFLTHVKNPPVLPNLQQMPPLRPINKEETTLNNYNVWFFDDIDILCQRWQSENTETVAELLIDFFRYFSRDYSYNTGVASIRAGLLKKDSKGWQNDLSGGRYNDARERNRLCIEDPFETDYNVARCVTKDGLYTIRGEFMRASRILASRPERAIIALAELCEERKDEDLIPAPPHFSSSSTSTTSTSTGTSINSAGNGGTYQGGLVRYNIPPQTPYSVGSSSLRPKSVSVIGGEPLSPTSQFFDHTRTLTTTTSSSSPPPHPPSTSTTTTTSGNVETSSSASAATATTGSGSDSGAVLVSASGIAAAVGISPDHHLHPHHNRHHHNLTSDILTSPSNIPDLHGESDIPTIGGVPGIGISSNIDIGMGIGIPTPFHPHPHSLSQPNPLVRNPIQFTPTHPNPYSYNTSTPDPEHMAPKRSKWTSPPPFNASSIDKSLYESQLDRSLKLGTRSTEAREVLRLSLGLGSSGKGSGLGIGKGKGKGKGKEKGKEKDKGVKEKEKKVRDKENIMIKKDGDKKERVKSGTPKPTLKSKSKSKDEKVKEKENEDLVLGRRNETGIKNESESENEVFIEEEEEDEEEEVLTDEFLTAEEDDNDDDQVSTEDDDDDDDDDDDFLEEELEMTESERGSEIGSVKSYTEGVGIGGSGSNSNSNSNFDYYQHHTFSPNFSNSNSNSNSNTSQFSQSSNSIANIYAHGQEHGVGGFGYMHIPTFGEWGYGSTGNASGSGSGGGGGFSIGKVSPAMGFISLGGAGGGGPSPPTGEGSSNSGVGEGSTNTLGVGGSMGPRMGLRRPSWHVQSDISSTSTPTTPRWSTSSISSPPHQQYTHNNNVGGRGRFSRYHQYQQQQDLDVIGDYNGDSVSPPISFSLRGGEGKGRGRGRGGGGMMSHNSRRSSSGPPRSLRTGTGNGGGGGNTASGSLSSSWMSNGSSGGSERGDRDKGGERLGSTSTTTGSGSTSGSTSLQVPQTQSQLAIQMQMQLQMQMQMQAQAQAFAYVHAQAQAQGLSPAQIQQQQMVLQQQIQQVQAQLALITPLPASPQTEGGLSSDGGQSLRSSQPSSPRPQWLHERSSSPRNSPLLSSSPVKSTVYYQTTVPPRHAHGYGSTVYSTKGRNGSGNASVGSSPRLPFSYYGYGHGLQQRVEQVQDDELVNSLSSLSMRGPETPTPGRMSHGHTESNGTVVGEVISREEEERFHASGGM